MTAFQQIGLVALGGAAGSASRHAISLLLRPHHIHNALGLAGTSLSLLVVNTTGPLALGFLFGFGVHNKQGMALLLMTGFLGGFTTFSSFALDLFAHSDPGLQQKAVLGAFLQLTIGIASCYAGIFAGTYVQKAVL